MRVYATVMVSVGACFPFSTFASKENGERKKMNLALHDDDIMPVVR